MQNVAALKNNGDCGTQELRKNHTVEIEVRDRASSGQPVKYGARVKDQTPIDRYFTRCLLDKNADKNYILFQAAERLRTDFYYSGLQDHTTSSFEPKISSGVFDKTANLKLDSLAAYRNAIKAINGTFASILVRVCLDEEVAQDWAAANDCTEDSGIVVLRLALRELAAHYGLMKLS